MMPSDQTWSRYVTQDADFENFLFCSDSIFIFGEVTKFLVEKLLTSEVISQKPHWGGGGEAENTPSVFRVNEMVKLLCSKNSLTFS